MNILVENERTQAYQPVQTKQTKKADTATETTASDAAVENGLSLTEHTDRVEISPQGRAALAQVAVVSTDTAQGVEAESQAQEQAAQLLRTVQTAQNKSASSPAKPAENGTEDGAKAVTAKSTETETAESVIESLEDSETATDEAVIESSESTSTNLTSLTEQQLDDLVSAGTISQAQATAELARRESAQRVTSESSSTAVQTAAVQSEE